MPRDAHQLASILCSLLEATEAEHGLIQLVLLALQLLRELVIPSGAQVMHQMHQRGVGYEARQTGVEKAVVREEFAVAGEDGSGLGHVPQGVLVHCRRNVNLSWEARKPERIFMSCVCSTQRCNWTSLDFSEVNTLKKLCVLRINA